ncbi:MAG: hypothetical protein K0B02_01825 [DPANN group archaeon]|nr:hypothetical protein [DPANN group archaeon]
MFIDDCNSQKFNYVYDESEVLCAAFNELTLDLIRMGTKEINYSIITNLPTKIDNIMNITGLTKMPVNIRLNDLGNYGLVKRESKGPVSSGPFTDVFMASFDSLKSEIKNKSLDKYLNPFCYDVYDSNLNQFALDLIRIGTKDINYNYIITILSTNVKDIMGETGLTKMSVNVHLNDLSNYGLVKRESKGQVSSGPFTNVFISYVKSIENELINSI